MQLKNLLIIAFVCNSILHAGRCQSVSPHYSPKKTSITLPREYPHIPARSSSAPPTHTLPILIPNQAVPVAGVSHSHSAPAALTLAASASVASQHNVAMPAVSELAAYQPQTVQNQFRNAKTMVLHHIQQASYPSNETTCLIQAAQPQMALAPMAQNRTQAVANNRICTLLGHLRLNQ